MSVIVTTRMSAKIRRAVMARARKICPHQRRLKAVPWRPSNSQRRDAVPSSCRRTARARAVPRRGVLYAPRIWTALARSVASWVDAAPYFGASVARAGGCCSWRAPRGRAGGIAAFCDVGRQLDVLNEKGFADYAKLVSLSFRDLRALLGLRVARGGPHAHRMLIARAGTRHHLSGRCTRFLASPVSSKCAAHLPHGCPPSFRAQTRTTLTLGS